MKPKRLIVSLILTALCLGGVLAINHVFAQGVDTGLNEAAQTGLSNQDPRVVVARIIQIALGFVGIIGVLFMLYAGWLWMSAKGNEEKIDQAKKLLKRGAIGLAIILSSFAIVTFILSRLTDATSGSGSNGVCSPSCSAGQYCCNSACQATPCGGLSGGENVFAINGTTPAHQSVNIPRNSVIRFHFTKGVRQNSVSASTFTVTQSGADVNGTRTVSGNYVEFVPEAACDVPNEALKCFAANTTFSVEAASGASGIFSLDNQTLVCTGVYRCAIEFTTGDIIDTEAPRVNITTQQICASTNNMLGASSIDNYGVSKIDFFTNDNPAGSIINNSNPFVGSPFDAQVSLDPTGYGESLTLKVTAYDLDSNEASAEKQIPISPAHCCNGIKDGDETDIDCGGSCISCEALNGPRISWVSPAGGFCSNNKNQSCRKQTEVQDCGANASCDLGTPNGAVGNLVTIGGSGFGTARGKVFFPNGSGGRIEARLADDPSGNPACAGNVWQDGQVIAIVPNGSGEGPIAVETANQVSDTTDDANGSLINNFKNNTIDRPGICALAPGKGKLNDVIEYQGVKLSSSEAYYGNLASNLKSPLSVFTSNQNGTATVPNLATGSTTTFVQKSSIESNFINFVKESEPYTGPIISSIEPLNGPVGQYVTIRGSGFGNIRGESEVHFGDTSGTEADYAFPDVCAESLWSDKQIVVKVPQGIATSGHKITVSVPSFSPVDSGSLTFQVTGGSPNPGICRIEPSLGQANSEVILWGEYFQDQSANSIIRFYNNRDQSGTAISFWAMDQNASGIKPWKIVTTVHQQAATGPVRVVAGSPAQVSNSLNFTVGQCRQDADCGSAATCCAAGLPEAGKCKASAAECYGSIATSVYEWQFSTGSDATCSPDQVRCGTACCAIGSCENEAESKCAQCLPGQNQCGDGSCCNQACTNETPSTCEDPTSCSGYSLNQCLEGYYCPNSPGLCSPYPGNGTTITGECSDATCDAKPGCENGACHYDQGLNRCVKDNSGSCSVKTVKNSANQTITINNQPVAGTCRVFQGNPRWHIDWNNTTCPAGWVIAPEGNRCIDTTNINGSCEVCGNNLSCLANGDTGICGVAQEICANGSTCDPSDEKCKETTGATCDCCCDKNQNTPSGNPGCCAGLSCTDSCGAGGNLGVCSGCAPGGVPDDSLCNCAGTSGKFCQVNTQFPTGFCTDCASITDPGECSEHAQCCVDGKNNNACTSIRPDGSSFVEDDVKYCSYYNCTNLTPNSCALAPVKNGTYDRLNTCQQSCTTAPITCGVNGQCDANSPCPNNMRCDALSCECKADEPPAGEACRNPETGACNLTCMQGYQCLLPSLNGGGGIGTDNTCRCCCKPPTGPNEIDTCKLIDEGLSCIANQGLCTSPSGERGACCGCSADSQCGDTLTTGCGLTDARCCQARPTVVEQAPVPSAAGVCRNPVIEAVFNQRMDISTFSDNVLVVGDYGGNACPNGYPIIAAAPESNNPLTHIARAVKKAIVRIVPGLTTKSAFADVSNFCAVSGSPVGYDIGPTQTKVSYQLTRALDPNIKYYVVVRGDGDLDGLGQGDEKDHYNTRITGVTKIGMLALNQHGGRIPEIFNNTTYPNSEIWSFTTSADVCLVDKVKVTPSFKLFQQPGQTETLTATAQDRSNQLLQSIPDYYAWMWDWSSDNAEIVKVEEGGQNNQAIATSGNKQDAQTLGKAKATITVDRVNQPSTVGQFKQGTSQLRLFLCENPWPVYYAYPPFPSGYNWPWKDDATGIEFYYCRDSNGVGTKDDLPAIQSAPLNPTTGRKICMFGSNTGNTCTSDANCNNIVGSCLPEVLKEFFFFREFSPVPPAISGSVEPIGKAVTIRWQPVGGAAKYKVYYGTGPGRYTMSKEAPAQSGEISVPIDSLTNNVMYYFVVTALSDKNQESSYSNEVPLKPLDTTAPAIPNVQVSSGDGKISLFWPRVSDATSYIAYLGVQPRGQGEYGVNSTVLNVPTNPNTPAIVFSNLNNAATYYLSVRSVDQYGNKSDYSPEIAKKPNEPYLISATAGSSSVTLRWLPFVSAQGYTIYVGTEPGKYDLENPISVGATATQHIVPNLNNGTQYYFAIRARKGNNQQSEISNERSATPGGNEIGG